MTICRTTIIGILLLLTSAITAAYAQNNLISLNSESGDPIGQGIQTFFDTDGGTYSAPGNATDGVTISFLENAPGTTTWTFSFVPATGGELLVGSYENAAITPSATQPGLAISSDGRSCSTVTGSFFVDEAVYDSNGEVERFSASFEQHCDSAAPGLFGSVSFNTGGFTGPTDTLHVVITANDLELPVNTTLADPDPGGPYTNTFTVLVTDDQGMLFPAELISIDLIAPDGAGALYFLDDLPEHEDGNGNPLAFGSLVFENTTGIVTAHFHALNQPGVVTLIASITDAASGSTVSDSLQLQVIDDGSSVTLLTFSGPFINAVLAGADSFTGDGTLSRSIDIIATRNDGQPAPAGTPINFFLIDSPIIGYPQNGAGSFSIAGNNGDPQEDGVFFSAPGGNFLLVPAISSARLVLNGGSVSFPDNRSLTGIRTIDALFSENQLTVTQPFNSNPAGDNGPSVPYRIGQAEFGTIQPTATTDSNGVATTTLNYPAERSNQTAILVACAAGNSICTVLDTCGENGAGCNPVYLPLIAAPATPEVPTLSTGAILVLVLLLISVVLLSRNRRRGGHHP